MDTEPAVSQPIINPAPEPVRQDGFNLNKDLKIFAVLILLVIMITGIVLYKKSQQSVIRSAQPQAVPTLTVMPVAANNQGEQPIEQGLSLQLTSPADKAVVSTPSISVSGLTKPGAEININDLQTKADLQGRFTQNLSLEEGENTIVVSANDDLGNYAEKSLTVTYNASASQTE